MSDEKIDLADLEELATWPFPMAAGDDVLALVRAVRAAMACCKHLGDQSREQYLRQVVLHAALAPFTDSEEVRSDA